MIVNMIEFSVDAPAEDLVQLFSIALICCGLIMSRVDHISDE
jgi:hypothetical protein